MSKTKGFLLAAGIVFAMAFILSCSSDDDGPMGGGVVYCNPVTYGGETYQTVVIGTQTWFVRNLNYNAPGSKCGGTYQPTENDADCVKYGRLYDWATAMGLPSSCNEGSCSDQPKHQGICPNEWHIPSNDDWDILVDYAGGKETAGAKLKATSGWNYEGASGNGTDQYGFSALPGGRGFLALAPGGYSRFLYAGGLGYWWSASEYEDFSKAYYRAMAYDDKEAYWDSLDKSYLQSVRCVKD